MIIKLDNFFRAILRVPLKALCRITGKSNLIVALIPTWGVPISYGVLSVLAALSRSYAMLFVQLMLTFVMTMLARNSTKDLIEADRTVQEGSEATIFPIVAIAQSPAEAPMRVFAAFMCLGFLAIAPVFRSQQNVPGGFVTLSILFLCVTAKIYWIGESIPPGKSLFSRAKSWAKNLGSARTTPKLAPGIAGA